MPPVLGGTTRMKDNNPIEVYTPIYFEGGVLHDGVVYMDVCKPNGNKIRIYNKQNFGIDGKVEALRYLADLVSKNELPDYTDLITYAKRMEVWTFDLEKDEISNSTNEKQVFKLVEIYCGVSTDKWSFKNEESVIAAFEKRLKDEFQISEDDLIEALKERQFSVITGYSLSIQYCDLDCKKGDSE